jgi:DNA-binding transcriptional regulator YhcF (GntR family)
MTGARQKRRLFEFRLDLYSGVPIYRQIIDQVTGAIATGALAAGDQLPTVRQLAVDLAVNPNTVIRAYRELEIRGVLRSQQGTGTFISAQETKSDDGERQRRLKQLIGDFVSRAGAEGFTIEDLADELADFQKRPRRNGG